MPESATAVVSHPPETVRDGLALLRAEGGPVTEAQIEALLREAGVASHLSLRADTYGAWLRALGEECTASSLAPWASVTDAVARGRAEVLGVLADRGTDAVACSRLQIARDIGVVMGAFLATGAAIAVPVHGGFSRAQLLRHGWRQLLLRPSLWMRMLRSAWRIDLHTNDRLIERFDEASWSAMYAVVGEVLDNERFLDGVVGSAWYYDAALVTITPHLRYLRTLPPGARALFIDLPPTPADTAYALKRSATRREAAARGAYLPHATLLYWPRRAP